MTAKRERDSGVKRVGSSEGVVVKGWGVMREAVEREVIAGVC
jgi:hypothetical protein